MYDEKKMYVTKMLIKLLIENYLWKDYRCNDTIDVSCIFSALLLLVPLILASLTMPDWASLRLCTLRFLLLQTFFQKIRNDETYVIKKKIIKCFHIYTHNIYKLLSCHIYNDILHSMYYNDIPSRIQHTALHSHKKISTLVKKRTLTVSNTIKQKAALCF